MSALNGAVPLTYEQDRYRARSADPSWTHKNVRITYEIRGPLDVAAFGEAVDGFVRRHDALRMRFHRSGDGALVQQAQPVHDGDRYLQCQRVAANSPEQFAGYASALLSRDVLAPWAGEEPPFHLRLLRYDNEHHAMLATFQNVVFDGRAHHLFDHEIWRDYAALTRGESPDRHAAPSFAAAAARQRSRGGADQVARAVTSWRDRLDFSARHRWVRPSNAVETADGAVRADFVGPAAVALRRSCEERGYTVMQWTTAAFARALAVCAGQRGVSLWTSMDSRGSADRDVVGMFAGVCPLPVREPGADLLTVAAEVRGGLLRALRHQQVTAEDVRRLTAAAESDAGARIDRDIYLNLRRYEGDYRPSRRLEALRVATDTYPLRRITVEDTAVLHLRCNEFRDAVLINLRYDGRRVGASLARSIVDHMAAAMTDGYAGPS